MNLIKKIEDLQNQVQSNKEELIKLNEREKNLKENKTKILEQLKEASIKEDELEETIEKMDESLQKQIADIEEKLK